MGVIMGKNLLLFDVGNTTTKVGLDGGAGMRQFSFRTDSRLTPDDIGNAAIASKTAAKALRFNNEEKFIF